MQKNQEPQTQDKFLTVVQFKALIIKGMSNLQILDYCKENNYKFINLKDIAEARSNIMSEILKKNKLC